ncbi:MAG TPA: hypothetical protein VGH54_19565 [Mycobacterium sp.]|uniref:hypothetical protein n=1 Tax=Mycobacterium sp. TaxID=1785 RepID=UPI002F428BDD
MPEAAEHKLQGMVDEIVGYRQRTRWWRWGTAVLAVVSLALGITVGILVIGYGNQAAALSRQTDALHSSQLANCTVSNRAKTEAEGLWLTFIGLLAGPHPSAAVKTAEARFIADVHRTYVLVDCPRAYPGG